MTSVQMADATELETKVCLVSLLLLCKGKAFLRSWTAFPSCTCVKIGKRTPGLVATSRFVCG